MRRGALPRRARTLRTAIARAIASQSVPEPLSRRIAFQLAFKLSARELHGRDVWEAVGRILRADILCLRERLGLTDHKIVGVLPKLSATRILEFLEELTRADRRIARTILNAAVDAAYSLAAGRRYLADTASSRGSCERSTRRWRGRWRMRRSRLSSPSARRWNTSTACRRSGRRHRTTPRRLACSPARGSARDGKTVSATRARRPRSFSKHCVELGHRCA